MSNSKGLDIFLSKQRSWLLDCFVFAVVIAVCLPNIYASRSMGYFDDTIYFVSNVLRYPSTFSGAVSFAFDPPPMLGIPSSELTAPGLTLFLWVLRWAGLLGNLSLNLFAALLLAVFAVLVRRAFQAYEIPAAISLAMALLFSLNPTNSEFMYLFVANQHLWSMICLMVLGLISLKILNTSAVHQRLKLVGLALVATLLSGVAAISTREVFAVISLVVIVFLLFERPTPSWQIVVIAWSASIPFQLQQMITGNSGWRVSKIVIVHYLQEAFSNSSGSVFDGKGFAVWIVSLLAGFFAQALVLRPVFLKKDKQVEPNSKETPTLAVQHFTVAAIFILAYSKQLQTLIVGSLPGFRLSLSENLDDDHRWFVIEPKILLAHIVLLGVVVYLIQKVDLLIEQILIVSVFLLITFYTSSLIELEGEGDLARYAIYVAPVSVIVVRRLLRELSRKSIRPTVITFSLLMVLSIQVFQFVDNSRITYPERRDAISILGYGCRSNFFGSPKLDLQILSAKTLSNDRWLSRNLARDLRQLSESPRLNILCAYLTVRSEGDLVKNIEFISEHISGPEGTKFVLLQLIFENGLATDGDLEEFAVKAERILFGYS